MKKIKKNSKKSINKYQAMKINLFDEDKDFREELE
jgi:hypothetical protein